MQRIPTTSETDTVLRYTVAYPDTDAAGVVFHGRYLEMAERARNNALALRGFSYASLAREYGTLLTVHKVEAVFHQSGILEDRLAIHTRLAACGPARTVWCTDIFRDNGGALLASISAEIVAVEAGTRNVRPYPRPLLNALAPYVAHDGRKAVSSQRR